jgi:3-oxoacyl-[acyl-carrier-protein] synthase-3
MDLFSDGTNFDVIMNACGERYQTEDDKPDIDTYKYYMDGGEVFNFSVTKVPEAIKDFCKARHKKLEDYNKIVLHQANVFILKHIANELKVSDKQVPISMDRYGNTNGASIPVTIVDMVENDMDLPETMELLISGFGIGLSWGVMSLKLEKSAVLPFVYTDDYYLEGKNIPYLEGDA